MTVYIAGPMASRPNYNYDAFYSAEERLREQGYRVLNPAKIGLLDAYDRYWPINRAMIDGADAIYMLDGWEDSYGAKVEMEYARNIGCECWFQGVTQRHN